MNISVPSRFACLNLEGDDFSQAKHNEKKRTEKQAAKKLEKTQNAGNKKTTQKQSGKKDKKNKVVSEKQWQEWKQKDDEFVNGNFEQDLHNAILLSKLDYEEKKDHYLKLQKDGENGKKTDKKKKNKPMSLEQFLGSNKGDINGKANEDENVKNECEKDEKFFERVQLEAKEELTKEKILKNRKEREANIDEVITIAHYQEKLEKEHKKNAKLQVELEKLRNEISSVKARNKTLCGILGHGEMKEKADVLMELERLNTVKNELTDEVTRLHGLLEQERSKVAALTSEGQKHKDKKSNKRNS